MRNLLTTGAAAAAVFAAFISSAAAASLSVYISYADWCGSCQVLMPKLQSAAKRVSANDIELVKLDFTDMSPANLDRQFERAGPLSPGDFMEDGRYLKTGFAYLVIGASVEGRVSAGMAEEDIAASFRAALGR